MALQTRRPLLLNECFLSNTADGVINLLKQAWGDDLAFPHIKMVFPTAPPRPYTLSDGELSTVWFDQLQMCPTSQELQSMDQMCHTLSYLINEEVNNAIPKNRIIIGGYSMGGAMAMALAYKYHTDIAGVFALSSYLNHNSSAYETLKNRQHTEGLPKLFLSHGERDKICSLEWAKDTYKILTSLGVKGEFHTYDIEHELIKEEIRVWRDWVLKQLPENAQ